MSILKSKKHIYKEEKMKTALKKLTAFMLAVGMMTTLATTVHASGYGYTDAPDEIQEAWDNGQLNPYAPINVDLSKGGIKLKSSDGSTTRYTYMGTEPPTDEHEGWFHHFVYNSSTGNYEYNGDYYWNGSKWMREGDLYSWDERSAAATSESGNNGYNGYTFDNKALLEALANEAAAKEAGFTTFGAMTVATYRNMSAFEYYNNMIINTPGIEEATPVGQGGKLIIDGKESGITVTLDKVTPAFVDSVRTQTDGTVLNVVKIGLPLGDGVGVVTTNFYMPGIAAGDEIAVLQYVDGAWVETAVTEIREDHVVVNLERSGVIAFIKK